MGWAIAVSELNNTDDTFKTIQGYLRLTMQVKLAMVEAAHHEEGLASLLAKTIFLPFAI